jgi:hypothetical protein
MVICNEGLIALGDENNLMILNDYEKVVKCQGEE